MTTFCGDCDYLNRHDEYKDWFSGETKFKCKLTNEYKKVSDSSCYSIKEFKDTGSYQNSGCLFTTIVCNILGKSDDHIVLKTLRNFRENYLKTNINYIPLLKEYDEIGPLISMHLETEIKKEYVANFVMGYFIIPCVQSIQDGNNVLAVEYYKNMVDFFKQKYDLFGIRINYSNDYDLENLGKGRRLQPKMSTI